MASKGDMMPLPRRPSNQKWHPLPSKNQAPTRWFSNEYNSRSSRKQFILRYREGDKHRVDTIRISCMRSLRFAFASAFLGFMVAGPLLAITEEEAETDSGARREARGLNPYSAPSIEQIFQRLDELKPLPFDLVKRSFAPASRAEREQIGMQFGGSVADGFLLVACQKKNMVDELGRVLLRQARSLGVGERVMRHSASLTELGRRGDWRAMRTELTATQSDVEQAMVDLHDQKMAHLISLGGWLRGLEICAAAVETQYTASRAKTLAQPDLVDYFWDDLRSLPPGIAQTPLFQEIRNGLASVRGIVKKAPAGGPTANDVKALHALARQMNGAVQPE